MLQNSESVIITKRHIKNAYKEYNAGKELRLSDLEEWIEDTTNEFIDSFNIEELKPVITSFKKGILEDLKICIEFEDFEKEEDIPLKKIKEKIQYIFENLNKISHYRDQVESTLSYLTVAKKEFLSFKKVISDFYSRNPLVKENIKQKKAIEESVESLTLDLSVYKSEIEGGISVLNSCIEILTKKQSLLLRQESSVRLLSKFKELDNFSNSRQNTATTNFNLD